jgi:uncharacterized protein GlcG (DUF336 family)
MPRKITRKTARRSLDIETLEPRLTMSVSYLPDPTLTPALVQQLLQRASAAAKTQTAIIAVVDRNGDILGVRAESGVTFSSTAEEVFAVDGAVAEARTAALFSSDFPNGSPLSSRAIQYISQSTITQREVDSSPESTNPTTAGPGYVAPIGLGGQFPPGISNTAVPDLFGIEGTNRDTLMSPGRFNTPTYVPGLNALVSYGQASGLLPTAQPRGIGTLPGGVPIYENNDCVGGIGVFFPGPNGYASYEQNNLPNSNQTQVQRENAPLALEAEWMAFAAAGGSSGAGLPVRAINGVAALPGTFNIPFSAGGVSLGGITVDDFGQHGTYFGPLAVKSEGASVSPGGAANGTDLPVNPANAKYLQGQMVPYGWLLSPRVSPDGSSTLTVANVTTIIDQGITEANLDRSQIRLPLGSTPSMVVCVSDQDGNILGLYAMPNETVFSLGVAVAKARNTAYYNGPNLQPVDQLAGIPVGTAFTNRTFRFLAEPRYPEGVGTTPGPWSALTDPGINPATAEDSGSPLPASVYMQNSTSELAYAAFNPNRNFREVTTAANANNQNGVVFFPGSAGVYLKGKLVGGLGVSGDGVDEDDVVTYSSAVGFDPLAANQVDNYFYHTVRLPYQEFDLNPRNK